MHKLFCTLILLSFACIGFAQQESQFTQFMHNKLVINPAYAGSGGAGLTALYRKQWVGFEGAPESKLLSFNAPIFGKKVGFGLTIANNKTGIMENWSASMAYSYNIQLNKKTSIRFGLQGTMKYLGIDFGDPTVIVQDFGDPSIIEDDFASRYNGNFGAGIYIDYDNQFYFGISAPNIFPNVIGYNTQNNLVVAQEVTHFYAMTGLRLPISNQFHFNPSILAKYVNNAPFDLDVNVSLEYNERLSVGVSYRLGGTGSGESADLLLFYKFNNIGIGLAYDYPLSELGDHNSGSLEALVSYQFKREKDGLSNPRNPKRF